MESQGRPGAENMAIDAGLLEQAATTGAAWLRLYSWDPACLSLGRNEHAERYAALIARRGIPVVRRPTGGSAVWHEHEVTYAVAAPIATFGSLRQAYHTIHGRLAVALRTLGAEATLAERPGPFVTVFDRRGPCFAAPAGGEIMVGGKKLVGSAQVRRGKAFLQHGSILLDGSQGPLAVGDATTLREVLGRPVAFTEVADAIVATWSALAPSAAR